MNTIQLFEKLIANSPDLHYVCDEDKNTLFVNQSFANLLEVSLDELKKSGFFTFIHKDDWELAEKHFKGCVECPDSKTEVVLRLVTKNGAIKKVQWNCNFDGKDKYLYATGRIFKVDPQSQEYNSFLYDDAKKLAKVGAWEYNLTELQLHWDDQVYDIYELNNSAEISLERMKQFFRKDSLSTFEKKMQELIEHGTPFDEELNFVSGKFRPSSGRFIGRVHETDSNIVIGTIQDLTDIKRVERKSEDYQEAVDKSSIVSITDRYGIITEVNDRFCEISKYSREELIGKDHKILNSKFHSEEFWKNFWETIGRGDVWSGEIQNVAKDGSYYWVDTTIVPFKNSIGRIYQYLSIQRDFTENKKLNEELMVSEKLSSIGEISAQILHEVMTPLSIISLSIENLEDDVEDLGLSKDKNTPLVTNLNEIKLNYERIEEIFNNMRSILVPQNIGTSQEINIKETIIKTLSLVNAKLKSKDVAVRINKVKEDAKVVATQSDLSQIFLNLLNNSCDAIEDREDKWIEVSTSIEAGEVVIRFQDSGPGIPPEVRAKIFDNLFTTKGAKNGTGLGMGVCRKLVQRHQGKITVDQEAPNTTFVISFPYKSN